MLDGTPSPSRERTVGVTSTPAQDRKARQMCASGQGIIAGEAAHGKAAFRSDCGSWDCPIAGERLSRRLRHKLASARPNRFFTLTIRHHPERTLEQEVELLKACWRKFRIWWAKQPRGFIIEECSIWELEGERHVHIHALARCAYLPVKILQAFFQREIDSFRQDVRTVRTAHQLAKYLNDYVTKGLTKLEHTHRYAATHGFFDNDEKLPGDPFFEGMTWGFDTRTLEEFAHHWLCRGWKTDLDMKRGRCKVRPP